MRASEANFGPVPENLDEFNREEHEAHVAEDYSTFRTEAFASARSLATTSADKLGWPEEHIDEFIEELEDLMPVDSAVFLDEVHKAWVVRDSAVSETLLLLRSDPSIMMEMVLGDGAGDMMKLIMDDIMPD